MKNIARAVGLLLTATFAFSQATMSHTIGMPVAFGLNAYEPVDPVAVSTYRELDALDGGIARHTETRWPDTNAAVNRLLPNHSASVVTYKRTASGGLRYLTGSTSAEKGEYRVVMDYIKYRDEPILDEGGELLGKGRVGIGLRMIADLRTAKADLDLGSLVAIGVNAKAGRLKGCLYVDVIGVDSAEVSALVPLSSVIDETAIQSALQSLAAIKSKLHDEDTELTPHIVAINKPDPALPRTKAGAETTVEGGR